MTTPIEIIPRGEDDINTTSQGDMDGVIENISTLNTNTTNTEPDRVRGEDDSITLSSATSATSHASTLSDGAPRPRSASLSILSTPAGASSLLRPSSTPRQRSTPRSRPRSNPRTRTPMRHESPLLVTGRDVVLGASTIVSDASGDGAAISTNNDASTASSRIIHVVDESGDESMIRNIFNTRRHRSRAGSIPEEVDEVIENNETSTANNASRNDLTINDQNSQSNTRTAGHWLARTTTTTNPRSTNPTRPRHSSNALPLSTKQRPSHRKLRRWNNDRFIGTSSEHLHIRLENREEGAKEEYWREFIMPNYPCEYRSEFAKLVTDETTVGRSVRERFLKGEVGRVCSSGRWDGERKGDDWMEHCVLTKFQKLGIVLPKTMTADPNESSLGVTMDEMGKKLFDTLSPRIQSVISRSCALIVPLENASSSASTTAASPSFASQVVSAFETYLVSLALAGSNNQDAAASNSTGYPPQQPQHVYNVYDMILSSPPKIVMKNKKHYKSSSFSHKHAVVVPTVHFYFLADDSSSSSSKSKKKKKNVEEDAVHRSTAFYRILLYAVCQFHGLESSSFIIAPKKGKQERGVKVVTVQGGVMLAPALRLLSHV